MDGAIKATAEAEIRRVKNEMTYLKSQVRVLWHWGKPLCLCASSNLPLSLSASAVSLSQLQSESETRAELQKEAAALSSRVQELQQQLHQQTEEFGNERRTLQNQHREKVVAAALFLFCYCCSTPLRRAYSFFPGILVCFARHAFGPPPCVFRMLGPYYSHQYAALETRLFEVEADLAATKAALSDSQTMEQSLRDEVKDTQAELAVKREALDRVERQLASAEAQLVTSQ